jgi:O-antigen biosynthesis protein WbqP
MKRLFDILLSLIAGILLLPPAILVAISVRLTSRGPSLYWSERVGRYNKIFKMPKFRTMRIDAPVVATHLMSDADLYITPIGALLRKWSIDEIPQLWCILMGTMSFVGPRPALFNQKDLISLRKANGVEVLTPGLTGWAQVNGRDELPINDKVWFDVDYLKKRSFIFDLFILRLTIIKVLKKDGVAH